MHTAADRPDLWERGIAWDTVWPEYNLHGDVLSEWWRYLDEELPDFQFVLYDESSDPTSLRITGTVAEWERWTAMVFPESGDHVFPEGLAPLCVDMPADRGSYWEPNVWMVHPDVDDPR